MQTLNFYKVGSTTSVPKYFYWANYNAMPISPSNWGDGEPDNYGGNDTFLVEGCVAIYANGFLNDLLCSNQLSFFCDV